MARYRYADEESLPPWLQDKGSEDEARPSHDEDHDDSDEDEDDDSDRDEGEDYDEEPESDQDEGDEDEDEGDEDDYSGDNTDPLVDVEPSGEVEVHEGRRRRSRNRQRQATGYDLPPHGPLPKGHPGASSYRLDPAWNYDDYGAIPHHEFPADASYDYEDETPHREPPRRGHAGDIYSSRRARGSRT